ncbi:beta-lactamase family protein [Calidifontibacter sp. DB0510]|uniref:Beta-lactamase family protein n=1 Tax=Metallococcus carri TaxID=1656884 RepID=A0A967B173_9MICO|nr:serine hydrolase domain-containing protein [Metallococcus carri]NHN55390.1 beta-lactamase family protein [Metallococcus carri]NOP36467.1 beta-lactamase family protein [Calidifontibacter sp. DB2511S]
MSRSLPDTVVTALDRISLEAQRASRTPAFVAGVRRDGRVEWETAIGSADLSDPSVPLDGDTQFPVASNTKTFTAVAIMQLRDEGRLGLEDRIDRHLPEVAHGAVTIRQMLAHVSGMQREPVGDVWDTLVFPDRAQLLDGWNQAARVLPPHRTWHYSNLCYALLGEVIARLDERPWAESIKARLIDPIGLRRTGFALEPPHSAQYFVPPFSDVPVREPVLDKGATDAAGAIVSTLHDMLAWHAFLLDPDSSILSPDTLEEMLVPHIPVDAGWQSAWGLGFQLVRKDDDIWFGHTGGLPGAITGFFSTREPGLSAGVLMNNTSALGPDATAIRLGSYVAQHDPRLPEPWMPGTLEPADLVDLTGRWFSEGMGFTFVIAEGELRARLDRAPDSAPWSRFERDGEDEFRTIAGRERGERLVVHRDANGAVRQLNWATYKFTRDPQPFTALG